MQNKAQNNSFFLSSPQKNIAALKPIIPASIQMPILLYLSVKAATSHYYEKAIPTKGQKEE